MKFIVAFFGFLLFFWLLFNFPIVTFAFIFAVWLTWATKA